MGIYGLGIQTDSSGVKYNCYQAHNGTKSCNIDIYNKDYTIENYKLEGVTDIKKTDNGISVETNNDANCVLPFGGVMEYPDEINTMKKSSDGKYKCEYSFYRFPVGSSKKHHKDNVALEWDSHNSNMSVNCVKKEDKTQSCTLKQIFRNGKESFSIVEGATFSYKNTINYDNKQTEEYGLNTNNESCFSVYDMAPKIMGQQPDEVMMENSSVNGKNCTFQYTDNIFFENKDK